MKEKRMWGMTARESSNERDKKADIRLVTYTDLMSSMLAIENNKENHPILNQNI